MRLKATGRGFSARLRLRELGMAFGWVRFGKLSALLSRQYHCSMINAIPPAPIDSHRCSILLSSRLSVNHGKAPPGVSKPEAVRNVSRSQYRNVAWCHSENVEAVKEKWTEMAVKENWMEMKTPPGASRSQQTDGASDVAAHARLLRVSVPPRPQCTLAAMKGLMRRTPSSWS